MTLFSPARAGGFRLLLAIAIVLTAWQMLTPNPTPLPVNHADKLAHAGTFLLLAFLADAGWPGRPISWRALALLAAYGAGIELAQGQIPNRDASALDLAANLAGLLLYAGLLGPWLRRRRVT